MIPLRMIFKNWKVTPIKNVNRCTERMKSARK